MRVLFDGTTLCGPDGGPGAGIEHYTSSLLFALAKESPQDTFFVSVSSFYPSKQLERISGNFKNIIFLSAFFPRIPFVSRHLLLPLRAASVRPDLFFSPFGQLPLAWRGKSVITVHDMAIYDHPEWFASETVNSWTTRTIVPRSIEKTNAIITVSGETETRVHAHLPNTHQKTHVVYEGVTLGNQKEISSHDRFPFDRDYVLFLGTIEPRKNLSNAFRAFAHFLDDHPEQKKSLRFIVAGKRGWNTQETESVAKEVGQETIQFLGPVTEEEKWCLLSGAACLLFPSLHEGFGLPILEAMSVGTTVITTARGAIPEVGGDAVIYVEPEDIEAMSFAIAQCVLVPQGTQYLREEGYRRATTFTWQETAKKTLAVLRLV